MLNLFNEQKSPLGLDLSDISLKIIQFEKRSGAYTTRGYSDILIPQDVMLGDQIRNPKLLVKTIRQAINSPKYGKVTTAYAVASVPETKSFVRVIQMPTMTEEEASEAVIWEAETYIPLPIGQVYLDWLILEQNKEPGKMTVLITASPKEYVDTLVAVLKAAGLKPLALEVESQATARSLISNTSEAVIIADINMFRTSLIIYDQGSLQFTSSLPIAGNSLTESIAKGLSLDMAKAEKLKQEVGLDPDSRESKVRKALLPVLNNLVEEIKNTIRFYEEHAEENRKIFRLFLTGGSSKLKHLPSFLHERLTHGLPEEHPLRSLPGIKVELGNPWVNILQKGQTPPLSREDSLGYATAIGLALR